ncbi:hypothetical protein ACIG3E_09645 [Streptomyces sp. NPDC053474]|uniref:hypothetical protein n=1 Tax=Streptomyces sp. NPDC053474 TaxID=3365704 RepID=UPI0037D06F7C
MSPAEARSAYGYTLVMPPGWTRIPLKEGTQEVVKGIVDGAAERLSRDLPKEKVAEARLELYRRLNSAVKGAQRRHGVDLYLPVEPMHGHLIAASFIVAKPHTPPRDGADPNEVLAEFLRTTVNSEPVQVAGSAAVRSVRTLTPNPASGAEAPSKHVDYIVHLPSHGAEAEWIVVSFSTIGNGAVDSDFTDILVELFDAVMTTFRWRTT